MTRRTACLVVVALVLLWLPETVFAQCAMCRSLLASPEGQRMLGAFRSGILLLLAAPFAVFATIAVLAIRGQGRRLVNSPKG